MATSPDAGPGPLPGASTIGLRVEGMSCGHCQAAVQRALASVPGVAHAEVDLAKGQATVQCSTEVSGAELAEAVRSEGYEAHAS